MVVVFSRSHHRDTGFDVADSWHCSARRASALTTNCDRPALRSTPCCRQSYQTADACVTTKTSDASDNSKYPAGNQML